jgi:hypothetical protein
LGVGGGAWGLRCLGVAKRAGLRGSARRGWRARGRAGWGPWGCCGSRWPEKMRPARPPVPRRRARTVHGRGALAAQLVRLPKRRDLAHEVLSGGRGLRRAGVCGLGIGGWGVEGGWPGETLYKAISTVE